MSPIAINFSRLTKTKYELNGPILSFSQQPVATATTSGGSITLTGIATASFPVQSPPNLTDNSGSIEYQWYEVGIGSMTGQTSNTLTLTNLVSPTDHNRNFYLESKYTSKSNTGIAINSPLNSDTVSITVYPVISITSNPENTSASQNNFATFTVNAELTDTTQGELSYQWQIDEANISDGVTVSGSNTNTLTISLETLGTYSVRCVVTHPLAGNSPLISDSATFIVVEPRPIIKIESYNSTSNVATLSEINLEEQELVLDSSSLSGDLVCLYASEKDVDLEIDLYASKGSNVNGYVGGQGGYSRINLTMQKNDEYILSGLQNNSSLFLYRKSSLIAVVGKGGDAGTLGNGGAGGGINLPGNSASNGGSGGQLIPVGELTTTGIFGSIISTQNLYDVDTIATAPSGGRTISCPKGDYWRNLGYSPCTDLGTVKFRLSDGTEISNSASISRGFKSGYAVLQTGGRKSVVGGGNGGAGATGGSGSTNNYGGGGGSGYSDGTIQVIQSTIGGNSSNSRVNLRLQGGNFYVDEFGRILILSLSTPSLDPRNLTKTNDKVLPGTDTCIDDTRWQNFINLATSSSTGNYRLAVTTDGGTTAIVRATENNLYKLKTSNRLSLRTSLTGWLDWTQAAGNRNYDGDLILAWDENSGFEGVGVDYSGLYWNRPGTGYTPGFAYYASSSNSPFNTSNYHFTTANWWILPPGVPDLP